MLAKSHVCSLAQSSSNLGLEIVREKTSVYDYMFCLTYKTLIYPLIQKMPVVYFFIIII